MNLYSNGLKAMQKKDFKSAKESFRKLLEKDLKSNPSVLFETKFQLAQAEFEAGNTVAARNLLLTLLQTSDEPSMVFRLKVFLSNIYFNEGQTEAAWQIMTGLKKHYPLNEWPMDARILYVTLEQIKWEGK